MRQYEPLVVETGVPIPRNLSEQLRELRVGESVVIPGDRSKARKSVHNALGPGHYITRDVPDGLRVWRTE